MGRPKTSMPALKSHICGQAVCRIDQVEFYLGKYGSPQSLAKYAVLIREYQSNGLKLPDGFSTDTLREMTDGFSQPAVKLHQADAPIFVKHVMETFRQHVTKIYANSKSEFLRAIKTCNEVIEHDGESQADNYGPKKLKDQRERWVKSGKCREYCNRMTRGVVAAFRHAVSEELIEETVWLRLKSLAPLREGQTEAHENPAREPASLLDVRTTAVELSPVLRSMVRIHLATGMRPTELCIMRPCDIDKRGEVWLYRPYDHKNKKRSKDRVIPLLGDAREVIVDYLNRPADSFCFSPAEAQAWLMAKKRSERKTKVQPSQIDRSKPDPQRSPGNRYTHDSYRVAIYRACDRAKVKRWFPYQLRHLVLTEVRDALTAEHAQAMGGHSRIDMTMTYAKAKVQKAIEASMHAPRLGESKS